MAMYIQYLELFEFCIGITSVLPSLLLGIIIIIIIIIIIKQALNKYYYLS